jgi:DNA-binding CsgD family transcriptional regulator
MHADERPGLRPVLIALLLFLAAGSVIDLALDAPERWLSFHVILELGIAAVSLALIVWLTRRWRGTARSLRTAHARLEAAEQWRSQARDALAGLSAAIDHQLGVWRLTPAEREVAFGLLRGLSLKRIATLTQRSERTVRQHAIAVYAKAGVAGRAELAAFFLDGLPTAAGGSLTLQHRRVPP